MFTVKKEIIAIGADHTDQGNEIRDAIIKYLTSIGRKVVEVKSIDETDSYVQIAEDVCKKIIMSEFMDKETLGADSGILIDQFGTSMCSVANSFYKITASVAWDPLIAYEVTRKTNPRILCVPTWTVNSQGLIKLTPEFAVQIVDSWANTCFLQDIPEELQEKYIRRQKQSERIHLGAIGATVSALKTGNKHTRRALM